MTQSQNHLFFCHLNPHYEILLHNLGLLFTSGFLGRFGNFPHFFDSGIINSFATNYDYKKVIFHLLAGYSFYPGKSSDLVFKLQVYLPLYNSNHIPFITSPIGIFIGYCF